MKYDPLGDQWYSVALERLKHERRYEQLEELLKEIRSLCRMLDSKCPLVSEVKALEEQIEQQRSALLAEMVSKRKKEFYSEIYELR